MNLQRPSGTASGPSGPATGPDTPVSRWNPIRAMLAALVAAGLLAAACGGDADNTRSVADQPDQASTDETVGEPLELDLGDGDAMASCLAVDADTLSQMSPAFGGTVTAVDGETITIDVDTWYSGADPAESVELHAEQGLEALIGGIDFEVGQRYLITAAEGNVNYCGYSGPADEALTALFDEAFSS